MATRGRAVSVAALALLGCAGARAVEPRAVYDSLRSARLAAPVFDASGLTIERDAFRLRFASGTLQFLAPVEGRVVGAVFNGSGSLELAPASAIERDHVALVAGEKDLTTLRTPFDRLVLLFTDGTANEIESAALGRPPPSRRVEEALAEFRSWQAKELRINLQLRILEDLLRQPASAPGVFLAWVPGTRYPPGLVAVDPLGLDWLIGRVSGESSAFVTTGDRGGVWYCSAPARGAKDAAPPSSPATARAVWYGIDTTILADARVSGITTIQLVPTDDGLRVLRLNLIDRMRIRRVEVQGALASDWSPAAFVQEGPDEDSDPAVLFGHAPPRGGSLRLRVTYDGGEVLRDAGDGNFLVGARDNWYPNLGWFHDLSAYELTYRHPKKFEVVSVGTKISERIDGETAVSVWKADRPIRVAGFNYGKFRQVERSDPQSGTTVRVYTNPGTPDFIHSLNMRLIRLASTRRVVTPDTVNFVHGLRPEEIGVPGSASLATAGISPVHVDPEILANAAIADSLATARIGTDAFGPLPDSRIAITQQTQAFSGQSWPALLYVPYVAALDSATRREIGLKGAEDFIERVVPHEFAHQWWGQRVGWGGYRDRWLSEGFAEFTASLVVEKAGGPKKIADYWEKARRRILATPPGSGVSNAAAGPIAMGPRLATPRNPWAYDVIVYSKGAYVLHMLRMWMRDWNGAEPDREFFETMKDFAAKYADRNPSTRDFQAVVERHTAPRMKGAPSGKMDWFFDQWVYGTDIPRLSQTLKIEKSPAGGYRVAGGVVQQGVPDGFRTVVQLFVELSKGELAHVASLPLVGNVKASLDLPLQTPDRPRRVLMNPHHEVLSRE